MPLNDAEGSSISSSNAVNVLSLPAAPVLCTSFYKTQYGEGRKMEQGEDNRRSALLVVLAKWPFR